MTNTNLHAERAALWAKFMAAGGRDVDLAEEIDALDRKIEVADSGFDFDAFVDGYIECALWADCYPPESEPDGELGGKNDLLEPRREPGTVDDMIERGQLRDFVESNLDDLIAYREERGYPDDYAGHDFWLTRNGHGAGFWDRGLGELGERLSEAARAYGSADDHRPFDCGDGTFDV